MTKLTDFLETGKKLSEQAIENEKLLLTVPEEKNTVQHSALFRQTFSEEVCQKLCAAFEEYGASSVASAQEKLLATLEDSLADDIPQEETPTLECLLYASRVANSRITNNEVFFDQFADVLARCYQRDTENAFKAVEHILGQWNWNCQAGLALIAAMKAEPNAAKRGYLLEEFDKYIIKHEDIDHELLAYKVKAMVVHGSENRSALEQIIATELGAAPLDTRIAEIIRLKALSIFQNGSTLAELRTAHPFARRFIKELIGLVGAGIDDKFAARVARGADDLLERVRLRQTFETSKFSAARFCQIIRGRKGEPKDKYKNYIPELPIYIEIFRRKGDLFSICCVATTYCQMVQGDLKQFEDFVAKMQFEEDFAEFLFYVFNQREGLSQLHTSLTRYFGEESCSALLQEGIRQAVGYNREVMKSVLAVFMDLLREQQEKTPALALSRFEALLRARDFAKKVQESGLLKLFLTFLADDTKKLEADAPRFFDFMIDVAEHCQPLFTRKFWYPAWEKTAEDSPRRERLVQHMGGRDVVSAQ